MKLPRRFALFGLVLAGAIAVASWAADPSPKPIKPTADDGRPLNLDFESGSLKDWKATGDAFDRQPIEGDAVAARRSDMHSNHQGRFWIGGFEVRGDEGTGTLTSATFKVTHPWASFLIGGGHSPETRAELVERKPDGKEDVFFKMSGVDNEELRPVVVDLSKRIGQQIFIRLVDESKAGWGHVNFDDFEFYDQRPHLPNEVDASHPSDDMPPPDKVEFSGLAPEKAAAAMTLQPGFKAHLFAAEPDIVQPIAFAIDARGRLWVAEGLTYPIPAPKGQGKDRIIVFEDADGSGHFTKRTVFAEGLNLVSGLEVGFGGVWVGAAPDLLFIPTDLDADTPKPTGQTEVVLDGFGHNDTHETLNTFTWGPDGWLYGCHGVFTESHVGKPGTPEKDRVHINAGFWRYHPTKKIFERFAEGTSNPWGIDFDEHGQLFAEACVIPHLWHIIQNARYQRQAGNHDDPYTYDDIKTIADHLHYAGHNGPHAGNGRSGSVGGGHAHAGLMVYLGASWPEQYRGQIFMNNIHGVRINMDIPEARGSGFVGHHGKDFILFNDSWSRIVNLRYDQDGSVYMIDWYDKQKCHTTNPEAVDRSNGRIYKVVYGDTKTTHVDLWKMTDLELANLQADPHEWLARTARRVLQERYAAGKPLDHAADEKLAEMLKAPGDTDHRLRALWALHASGAIDDSSLFNLLGDADPYVVAWSIQFLCEGDRPPVGTADAMARLAKGSSSPVVRLYLASAALRIPIDQRPGIIEGLLGHAEDATDHNLPLMDWYALESIAEAQPKRMLSLALETRLPNILEYAVRRLSAGGDANLKALAGSLDEVNDDGRRLEILRGIDAALKGRRSVSAPPGWDQTAARLASGHDPAVREAALALSAKFGVASAATSLRAELADAAAPAAQRQEALAALLEVKDPTLPALLQKTAAEPTDPALRAAAVRGLAAYDDPKTAGVLLDQYDSFTPEQKKDALATLSSRPAYAEPLLGAVSAGKISEKDLSADVVRQLRNLHDSRLDPEIARRWGTLRETPESLRRRMEQIRGIVQGPGPAPDLSRGRLLFSKTCMQCHTLYDTGGHVGPDLTGSNRGDLRYLLENAVDPNAIIPPDYMASTVRTKDDRIIIGIIKKQDAHLITVQTVNELLTLGRDDIESIKPSKLSMMPEGILNKWSDRDLRDLIAYLRNPRQVPMPAGAATAPASAH